MNKRLLPAFLLVLIGAVAFFSCKKHPNKAPGDATRAYFPLQIGKYVVYNVDSTYYIDTVCKTYVYHSQLRYVVSDTFRDEQSRLSYLINVYYRAYDLLAWQSQSVIEVTPTDTSLEYVQNTLRYVKLRFPITPGFTWKGNAYIEQRDTPIHYFNNWNYVYQNNQQPFNTGYAYFDNTVTVLEDNEQQNDPNTDISLPAYRTYAKEIYANNIGMIYKEMTHWTYSPDTSGSCLKGYSVVMKAIDHN